MKFRDFKPSVYYAPEFKWVVTDEEMGLFLECGLCGSSAPLLWGQGSSLKPMCEICCRTSFSVTANNKSFIHVAAVANAALGIAGVFDDLDVVHLEHSPFARGRDGE